LAWTDACKIEACNQIEHKKEILGGVRPAIRNLSKESGIPQGTLKDWYYPSKCPKSQTHISVLFFENGIFIVKNNQNERRTTMHQKETTKDGGRALWVFEQMARLDKEIECFQEELQHFINRTHFIRRNEERTAGNPPVEQPLCCELAEYLRLKSEQIQALRDNVKFATSLLEI